MLSLLKLAFLISLLASDRRLSYKSATELLDDRAGTVAIRSGPGYSNFHWLIMSKSSCTVL